ncbi:methylenetetrahydrofolate--tRNA-(uracil(54)-C(5))-methyltransferase (FADH(2)-oxidizing) TrmFO [Candidatus Izimaplasma bacterium ZiA1]|uniref:methylenetetrahydrofolate--tRNA-(uracil(54)- C(5))-methyltransferase (FADH(2)-oxidizing) TrmFO n=1 Tax=Candidatus Izimoplasma sp. ZiA1 TaxID=2024899 RepID=UPI000BAA64A7|nr:methylenetetrahydrofolate--tRNA-(uracil(54)-C(5))-methyltransferase (FADH(2)-oxidizing) TrmFO [Candidatus Izimaplasma bacterium ZiA1]
MKKVIVIGAGLAGSEAAYQLAKRGINVDLYEMRPVKSTEAHKSALFAELVCSNSLRSDSLENAVGLLKEEMRMLDSLIIRAADNTKVPAGSALAVDRDLFSQYITDEINNNPLINVITKEVTEIPKNEHVIIASGPLTSDSLSESIMKLIDEDYLYFYDAAAPIVTKQSINFEKAYFKSRYDKGEADYINCPMNKEEFMNWYHELIKADTVKVKDFELKVFEGCMPFEEIARRGIQTLLFGPMKPVGLEKEGELRPHAVVQLRQDNKEGTLYNIVGFQTHLTFGEQKRIIRMIPGLENAEIVRYGVMHKNTFINSPKLLTRNYQMRSNELIHFAGQITGVEGYVESAGSGLLASISVARKLLNKPEIIFPETTIIGSESNYISFSAISHFQPMNANYGILQKLDFKHYKKDRKRLYKERSIEVMKEILTKLND